jgi:hypothetical protein
MAIPDGLPPLRVHRQAARAFLGGVPERTFARLEAEGVIVPAERGKAGRPSVYDLAVITPAYIKHLQGAQPASGDREARARRDRSQADLNELRLLEARRELLKRETVVRDGKAFVAASRAKLLALPRRLVQAGLVPLDQQPAVLDLVREALEEMARWRTAGDLGAAATREA